MLVQRRAYIPEYQDKRINKPDVQNMLRKINFYKNKIAEAAIKAGHVPAEIPTNEEERLQDLKRLKLIEKNIQKDKRFSSFPKLAATLTGCKQSAIHILDNNTQHCKVSYGKDLPTEVMTKEAPRKLAICSHVLNNNSKPLVI